MIKSLFCLWILVASVIAAFVLGGCDGADADETSSSVDTDSTTDSEFDDDSESGDDAGSNDDAGLDNDTDPDAIKIRTINFGVMVTQQFLDRLEVDGYETGSIDALKAAMQQLEDYMNLVFTNSQLPVIVEVKEHIIVDNPLMQHSDPDDERSDLTDAEIAINDNISTWTSDVTEDIEAQRHRLKLDAGAFYQAHRITPSAGLQRPPSYNNDGTVRWWKLKSFSNIGGVSLNIVALHEMGHGMGLRHSPYHLLEDGSAYTGTVRDWGLGWGVRGKFTTVMAYGELFKDETGYEGRGNNIFSSPDLTCYDADEISYPCGVPAGEDLAANACDAIMAMIDAFSAAGDLAGEKEIVDLPNSPLKILIEAREYEKENEEEAKEYGYDVIYTSQIFKLSVVDQDFSNETLEIKHLPLLEDFSITGTTAKNVIFKNYDNPAESSDRLDQLTIADGNTITGTLQVSNEWVETIKMDRNEYIGKLDVSGAKRLKVIKGYEANLQGHVDLTHPLKKHE